MRIPTKVSLIVALLLPACSTIPNVSHYMLPDIAIHSSTNPIEATRIELPEYIDHQDVVLELDTSSFHRANFHKWSEPLEDGITRLLERLSTQEKPIPIELAITRFHGTESGYVNFSGRWRQLNTGDDDSAWNPFEFQAPLPKSGYSTMIEAQAHLVDALRLEIAQTISRE